ncbi:MAG: N-acetyltransferase, partial [Chloroflexi bacterium]|nr:N-acetyltransferase [Chloroflexota bacterium]
GDVTVGDHFHAAHYVVVRAFVKMGDYCTMLNHATIEGIVRLGTGVRIMTNVYISSRTWVGDHVFIGPRATFLNGKYPGRRDEMRPPRGATVEDDVMIGGGATILPEITIGERSFIAAGAVVTKDVPPRSFVAAE